MRMTPALGLLMDRLKCICGIHFSEGTGLVMDRTGTGET